VGFLISREIPEVSRTNQKGKMMKYLKKAIPTRFAADTRFEFEIPIGPARRALDTELDRLKNRLVNAVVEAGDEPALRRRLRQAANEAATMAWLTPYPLLVLPALVEEKAWEVRLHAQRQQEIRARSQALLAVAA
jgi:hypothetical protein